MTHLPFKQLSLKLALLVLLALPELVSAQVYFNYNDFGSLYLGFRKTGNNVASPAYEMVVTLGSVTNFLTLPAGTTTNITEYSPSVLTYAFANGYGNLQWSAFSSFPQSSPWVTGVGSFPASTLWFTLPCTSVIVQSQPPVRSSATSQNNQKTLIFSVGDGAYSISQTLGTTNAYNNTNLVVEPTSFSQNILSAYIGDINAPTNGDFGAGGNPLPDGETVENWTPSSFTTSERSDLYQVCPSGKVDPISGSTTSPYFIGYFILNANGTMTFTRASAVTAPSAGKVSASVTNGFGPLTVVFTNTASGSITDWVWNFGNGTIITNTTGGDVTNTYANAGDYTVTLAVYGPGGSATNTVANFIVASPKPKISLTALTGKVVFSGTNCPVGVQYRILTSTNITTATGTWKPVYTNTFATGGTFAYTNSDSSGNAYFIMASP
jgi:PKD repeat protein